MSASPNFPKLPSNWTESSLHFFDDSLHLRFYKKNSEQNGNLLFIVHGQAEQSDRYEHFPHFLQSNVDAIAIIDLPGHGLSKGIRGHIENFDQYSKSVLLGFYKAKELFEKEFKVRNFFWFGHSLGGLISLRTLAKENKLPISSVSVSASLLELAFPVPKIKAFAAGLIEPLLGKIKLWNELDANNISHDQTVIEYYKNNSLNHKWVTPRFFVNLQNEMASARENLRQFPYSLQMIVPMADKIVSPQAQIKFISQVTVPQTAKKDQALFPDFFHESFNEVGKEKAFEALKAWLEKTAN